MRRINNGAAGVDERVCSMAIDPFWPDAVRRVDSQPFRNRFLQYNGEAHRLQSFHQRCKSITRRESCLIPRLFITTHRIQMIFQYKRVQVTLILTRDHRPNPCHPPATGRHKPG